MKKLLSALLCGAIMLGMMCTGITFSAAESTGVPTISLSVEEGERGSSQVVSVDVVLSDNPGIICLMLNVKFPSQKLELVGINDTGVLGGWYSNAMMIWEDSVLLVWEDGLAMENNRNNGVIANLMFKVKNFETGYTNTLGFAEISLSYNVKNTFDFDLNPVEFQTVNGGINIICNHIYTDYISNNDADCLNDGTKYAYCDKGCKNKVTVADEGTAKGHRFTDYVYQDDATCEEDGTEIAICDNGCGETHKKASENTAKGHRFTDYVYQDDATCEEDGTEIAICDNGCGETHKKASEGTAKGHDWIVDFEDDSSCTMEGTRYYVCTNDYMHTKSEGIDLAPHEFGEWIVVKEPSVTDTGIKRRDCINCDYYEEEELDRLPEMMRFGDATGDGVVNIKDATQIQKAIAGLLSLGGKENLAADVDGNGSVNIKDATAIQKYIAGIVTNLPIGELFEIGTDMQVES